MQDNKQLEAQIVTLLQAGKTIEAVKLYRQQTNVGLKEAADKIKEIRQRYQIQTQHLVTAPYSVPIALFVIVLFVGGIILFGVRGLPHIIAHFNKNNTPMPGDPQQFDPVATLPAVSAFAGPASQLVDFKARYVRSDGTLDLTANYNPEVNYAFERPMVSSGDSRPLGAGGGPGPHYLPINVLISKPGRIVFHHRMGGGGSAKWHEAERGMRRTEGAVRAQPAGQPISFKCSLKDLWDHAIAAGAQGEAVAIIEYDANWGYSFRIADTTISLRFNDDCEPVDRDALRRRSP